MRTIGSLAWVVGLSMVLGAASAHAQAAPWRTVAGGDPQGDYLSVDRPVHEGTLGGTRTVERVTRATGYTTGGLTTIVLSGGEAEDARTIRVHLPYGAALDLAQGEVLDVTASSHLLGLGSVHEVRLARGSTLIVLATSAPRSHGVTIARGAEVGSAPSDPRHQFALDVTLDGLRATVRPGQLTFLSRTSMLLGGGETIYEGVRPPDAFDSRVLTAVRLLPLPPTFPPAVSS